ncbi:hypothetical protein EVAR_43839_1 [Eumeta japonica]|uniref:Uncharacterized protein n=1 Tax=Eumeta variegata TaxID=151549 RepID=A0A4C1WX14_EUMVA|nr:hypothetical protein EVAR_43839_1 [Eumeta japonica]
MLTSAALTQYFDQLKRADLHVTGDEVWLMANSLTRFGYSRLDVGEYNFYIYRGNVSELIDGTICEPLRSMG